MAYPGAKVHRVNRRKLGRGQYPASLGTTAVLSLVSADVVAITFARPVVVTGTIPMTTTAGAFASQAVISPTVVQQTFSTNQSAATLTLPSNPANVLTAQGGGVAGTSVTF
jgi:hypothetical protein